MIKKKKHKDMKKTVISIPEDLHAEIKRFQSLMRALGKRANTIPEIITEVLKSEGVAHLQKKTEEAEKLLKALDNFKS